MNNLSPYVEKDVHFIDFKKFLTKSFVIENTALKDKFGRSICFGDILVDENNNLLTPVVEVENGEHVLFFKPLMHINSNLKIGCKSTYSDTLIVVGNIYEKNSYKGLNIDY